MANQDNLTIGGIGADPTGAYTQIETGWNPTYADGAVKWLPSSASVSSVVTDTGTSVDVVVEKGSSATGYTEATPDTYQIQGVDAKVTTATSVRTDFVQLVVTVNTGSAGAGTFTLADAEIASISNVGLITFQNGTVFDDNFEATITYRADVPDSGVAYYEPLPVTGAKNLTIYHPASGDAEVTAKFQWTDDDVLSIDGVEQATWADLTTATASAQAALLLDPSVDATWTKLDKMKYIRLVLISTDAAVNGVADVSGVFEHATSGAYIGYADSNTLESNQGIVAAYSGQALSGSIGGIGADPS